MPKPAFLVGLYLMDSGTICSTLCYDGSRWQIGYATVPMDPTSVREVGGVVPSAFGLGQNYPNPFNPSTTFAFNIPYSSFVILKVYDILGSEVATLVNEELKLGSYEVAWDALRMASGVYFYRFQAGEFLQARKLLLLR